MEKDVSKNNRIFDKNGVVKDPFKNQVCKFCLNSAGEGNDLVCQLWPDWDSGPGRFSGNECRAVRAAILKTCSPQEYRLDFNRLFEALKGEST